MGERREDICGDSNVQVCACYVCCCLCAEKRGEGSEGRGRTEEGEGERGRDAAGREVRAHGPREPEPGRRRLLRRGVAEDLVTLLTAGGLVRGILRYSGEESYNYSLLYSICTPNISQIQEHIKR